MRRAAVLILPVLIALVLWPPLATPAATPEGSSVNSSIRPSVGAPANISQNSGTSQHPALAVDSFDNLHIAWQDDSGTPGQYDILYRRWNLSPVSLGTPPKKLIQNPGLSDYPSVAADPFANKVHVVWEDDSAGNFDILYTRSEAGAWSAVDNPFPNSGASYRPKVATDQSGILHVVWSDNTPGNYDILHRTWNGAAWSQTSENLTQNSGASIAPAIASVSGNLHVVWADNTSGNYQIFYRRWTGAGWTSITNLSQSSGSATAPAVAANSAGNIAVVWQSDLDLPGSSQIFYTFWDGSTWSSPQNLSQNVAAATSPAVAFDKTGKIHVAWSDDSLKNNQIFYRYWSGIGWADAQNISQTTGGAYTPAIAGDSQATVHVVWADNTPGNYEIFYTSPSAPPSITPTATPLPTAMPASNQIPLSAGWNLISVRTALQAPSLATVFTQTPAVTKVFYFSDGAWSYAFRGPDGWNGNLSQISDGKGYWAFAAAPATLILQPDPAAKPPSYSLPSGWSLIGYSSNVASRTLEAYLTSLQGKWTMLYRYDSTKGWELAKPASAGFAGFTDVTQGRGYWIYLTAPGMLTP